MYYAWKKNPSINGLSDKSVSGGSGDHYVYCLATLAALHVPSHYSDIEAIVATTVGKQTNWNYCEKLFEASPIMNRFDTAESSQHKKKAFIICQCSV